MTVKDHSIDLVYLAALPRKTAKFVVTELEKYFGLVGYPHIFHTGMWRLDINNNLDCVCDNFLIYVIRCFFYNTDNGKEFIAKFVVDMMKHNNPNWFIVTGRPRTPRNQGSVESANKLVQRVMKSISL